MATGEQKKYPQSYIAQGSGDFISVQNWNSTTTNNAKQVHTLREKGSGYTLGTQESTTSFDCVLSEDGPERNFWRQCIEGEPIQLRHKIPGGTVHTYNGVYQSIATDGPLDDATKVSVTFIGHQERP